MFHERELAYRNRSMPQTVTRCVLRGVFFARRSMIMTIKMNGRCYQFQHLQWVVRASCACILERPQPAEAVVHIIAVAVGYWPEEAFSMPLLNDAYYC
jgi:hypothetical protein